MAEPFQQWTVLPHEKMRSLDDRLVTVTGDLPMPFGDFPRRMTIVRLVDGRLVIFSALALDEPEMRALEKFGKPSFLVIPSDIHRMDAKIWKDRYPDIVVVAPPGARKKAEEVVGVDTTEPDFGDRTVRYMTVPGTDGREAALLVETSTGKTLVLCDLIWNVHHRRGFGGFLFRLFRLTSEKPQIASVVRLKIKNKGALREQFLSWANLEGLNRIVLCHGDVVERDPPGVLREIADSLAA